MAEFQEKYTVLRQEQLADDIFRLSLDAPKIAAAAQPGQFVMVRTGESLDPLLRRPFSIHKVIGETVALLYKVVGKGTRVLTSLGPGDSVDVVGPLGRGFDLDGPGPRCLVGGGMGIAPLYFLARQILQQDTGPNPPILLGARTRAELQVLADEFTELGFVVLTATDDGSLGHHGLVTELLDDILHRVRLVQVCGPVPMMRTVARQCDRARVPCQVSLETHMACGLGACLGCTCPAREGGYKHVCKDGPVLSADEVAWI